MIKRHNFFVISIAILASGFIWISALTKQKTHYNSRVLKTNAGWGYEILVNDSLFIHQEFIPSSPGRKGFESKAQANAAAETLIRKLKQGMYPRFTTDEIEVIKTMKE